MIKRAKVKPRAKPVSKRAGPRLSPFERQLVMDSIYHGSSALVDGALKKPIGRMQGTQIKRILKGISLAMFDPKWQESESLSKIRKKLLREFDRRKTFSREAQQSKKN